jgi:chloramphenicol 3-O phosphotransferase
MVTSGQIVILNGTSSSGKTTLANRVHDLADDHWVVTDQDDFTRSLQPIYVDVGDTGTVERPEGFFFARDANGSVHVETGPTGRRVLAGYRRATVALARSGNNVVVAEAKFDRFGLDDWIDALQGLRALWVAVRCSLEECQRRELERGDRIRGLAAGHYDRVHESVVYDVEVDLTNSQVDVAALQILGALEVSGRTRRIRTPQ